MPIKFGNNSNLFDMSNPVGYTGTYPNIVENSSGVSSKWYEVSEVAKENAITVVFNPKENSSSAVFGFVASNDMETLELRAGIFNTAAATIDEDNVNVLLSSSAHFKNMLKYKYVRFYYINYNKMNHAGVYLGNNPDQKFVPYGGGGSIVSVKFGSTEIAKIYRGSELVYQKSRLPEAYTASEYLQSSGTQYIDTGVIANQDTKLTMDMEFLNEINEESPFGAYESGSKFLWNFSWSTYSYPMFGSVQDTINHTLSINKRYALEMGQGGAYIDGTQVKTYSAQTFQMTGSINLFRRNPISGTTNPRMATIKMYGCKIYQGDILIHEYLPAVRNSDSVAGLYDTITGAFLTNAGTGEFGTTVGIANGKSVEFNTSSKALTGWQVKGDTEQDGTPTPTAPVEVKTVTGRNTVSIVGKNIAKLKDGSYNWLPAGQSWNISNGVINATRTNSSYQGGAVNITTGAVAQWASETATDSRLTESGGTYTITFSRSENVTTAHSAARACIYGFIYDANGNNTSGNGQMLVDLSTETTGTYTLNLASDRHLGALVCYAQFASYSGVEFKVQLEKGSVATLFQPYLGQEVEVNLGKNLFDKSNANVLNCAINQAATATVASDYDRSIYIPCVANTTYTISKIVSDPQSASRFRVGFTEAQPTTSTNLITTGVRSDTNTSITITSPNNAKYIVVYLWTTASGSTTTLEDILNSLQIERGSKATEYASYFEPIELCKLNTYQDRIYKEGDTWKIEKQTNSMAISGSVGWTVKAFSNVSGYSYCYTNGYDSHLVWNKYGSFSNIAKLFSNSEYLVVGSTFDGPCFSTTSASQTDTSRLRFAVPNTIASDANAWKTWLNTNQPVIYYPLATPTVTDITDPTLIAQLNELEKLNANIGYNLVETSGSVLAPYIEFKYKKQ